MVSMACDFARLFRGIGMPQQEIEELIEAYGSEEEVPLATGG